MHSFRIFIACLISLSMILSGCFGETSLTESKQTQTEKTINNVTNTSTGTSNNTHLQKQKENQSSNITTIETIDDPSTTNINEEIVLDTNLKIYILPNGAEDAILIMRKDFNMLFGVGRAESYTRLKSYLTRFGVKKIDIVVLPNEWNEQIGGFQFLANDFKIGEIWKSQASFVKNSSKTALYNAKLRGALERQVQYGDTFERNGITIKILNPQKELLNSEEQDSVAIKVAFVDFCALIFSESEQSIEYKLKGLGENLECQILKGSKHGGPTATSDLLIRTVTPDAIIFTTDGSENKPHKTTLERIKIYNNSATTHVNVYSTHINGLITIISDGKLYKLMAEK